MNTLTYKGKRRSVPDMTLQEFFAQEQDPAVLAVVDGKLTELSRPVKDGSEVRAVGQETPAGESALFRLAILMLLKAFYSAAGNNAVKSVHVDFSLDDAFYILPEGSFHLDEALLSQVADKMHKYKEQAWPVIKSRKDTGEAIRLFHKHHMDSKARLFNYRLSGYVHLYSLGQFDDYFYGHMPPDCSFCPEFALIPWKNGFFLHLGKRPFVPEKRPKMLETLHTSSQWSSSLHCRGVADLNDLACAGRADQLIQIQEALQEKEIGKVAEAIVQNGEKRLVMIAGPSSSSKTTFAHRLCTQLSALGKHPIPISVDDYFVDREYSPRNADGSYNFEGLASLDLEQLNRDLLDLLEGKEIQCPTYNFVLGKREYHGRTLRMDKDDLLVIEGIHALNDEMTRSLPAGLKFKIFISALSQLSIDEHNPIRSTDGRLLRRIVRDARTRGYSASETISMWPSVQRGEDENINPYQENADIVFNSALVYELAVLKTFAEPLLFGISRSDPNYEEGRRLLKFLDYFIAMSSELVPANSLLREFIG